MLPTWFAINALTVPAATAQVLLAATAAAVAWSLLSEYDLIAACLSVMPCQLDCLSLLVP